MIITIDKKDVEHIQKVCTTLDYSYRFFTNESNPDMLQVEVEWIKGEELKPTYAYHFGRMVETLSMAEAVQKML